MKKLLPLFLLLFCLQTAYAQKIRFTDTSNRWTYLGDSWGNGSHAHFWEVFFSGDTVIQGKSYHLQYNKDNFGQRLKDYVREDTAIGRVFIFRDTTEYLLYDYGYKIGDTVIDRYWIDTTVVKNIDSVTINGLWYKIWITESFIGKANPLIIVEGIGELKRRYFENGSWAICFSNNGIPIYFGNYLTPQTCALSINNITSKSTTATISPNPANEYSKITFPYAIQSGSLYITNMLGQVVIQRSIVNSEQVYIGNGISADGVYFYKVTDNQTGNNFTGRFVYQ